MASFTDAQLVLLRSYKSTFSSIQLQIWNFFYRLLSEAVCLLHFKAGCSLLTALNLFCLVSVGRVCQGWPPWEPIFICSIRCICFDQQPCGKVSEVWKCSLDLRCSNLIFFAESKEPVVAIYSTLWCRLNTNKNLYEALKRVTEHGDVVPTTAEDDYVSKLFLFDFEQSGIHLDAETVSNCLLVAG